MRVTALALSFLAATAIQAALPPSERMAAQFTRLPIRFEVNAGQAPGGYQFIARGAGYTTLLQADAATYIFRGQGEPVRLTATLRRANARAVFLPEGPVTSLTNYLIGADSKRWRTDVPNYASVTAAEVYPGIAWSFYGEGQQLEYDFRVAPGADPGQIIFDFRGTGAPQIDGNGDLLFSTPRGALRQQKPFAYQIREGVRTPVEAAYSVHSDGSVGFTLGNYDSKRALVLDPAFVYGTYFGGDGLDRAADVAVDSAGAIYLTGTTESSNFPLQSAFDSTLSAFRTVFVSKLSSSGNSLIYSTYVGGTGAEEAFSLAVDSAGAVYVTGTTASPDFPAVNAFDSSRNGSNFDPYDAFVFKLNPAGSALQFSTYLGGSSEDRGYRISVDSAGSAVVAGTTNSAADFPLKNAVQANGGSYSGRAFVTKFTPAGNALVFSTKLSGTGSTTGRALAIGPADAIYLGGTVDSFDFPVKNAFDSQYVSDKGYMAKFSSAGALEFATYLGCYPAAMAVDSTGAIFIASRAGTLGATPGAFNTTPGPGVYVAKFNPAGSALVYGTFLGGTGEDYVYSMALTPSGAVYVAGTTTSDNFPLVNAYDSARDINEMFVARLSADGARVEDSTFIGRGGGEKRPRGLAIETSGAILVAGSTLGAVPISNNALSFSLRGLEDAFVLRYSGAVATVPVTFTTVPAGLAVRADYGGGPTPFVVNWAPGSAHTLNVISPQYANGSMYAFASWSNGGAQQHNYTAPNGPATLTASFTATPCTYDVTPASRTVGLSAQIIGFFVNTPAGCPWTYQSNAPWIVFQQSDGYTYVNFAVDAFSGASRSGTVSVAGRTITINQGSAPPEVTAFNTTSNSLGENLGARFDHPDGADKFTVVNILINQYLDGRNACYLAYDAVGNVLYLVNDAGTAIAGAVLGQPGTLSNGQCSIDSGVSSAFKSGTVLTLTLRMTYTSSFGGRKVLWGAARDNAGRNSGWVPKSVRHVPPASPPALRAASVTPLNGTGATQQFTIVYTNTGGGLNFRAAQVLINNAIDGGVACYVGYDRVGNVLYLLNDTGTALLLPGIVPNGGVGTIENSQCRLNGSGITMSESGDSLTLGLNVTFKAAFAGPRIVFTGVQSATGNSGWEAMASWLVP